MIRISDLKIHFIQEGQEYNYNDIANFISEVADGNYFVSNKIEDVWIFSEGQGIKLNITSIIELARILDECDAHKFRENGNISSCIPNPEAEKVDTFKEYIYFDCDGEECRFKDVKELVNIWAHPTADEHLGADKINDVRIYGNKVNCNSVKSLIELLDINNEFEDERTQPDAKYVSKVSYDDAISVLVANMPKDHSEFNSETGYGEPQHYMDLPNGRSLEIVHEEEGLDESEQYYSWRIHCNEAEFDADSFKGTMGIIAEECSNDFEYDTVYSEMHWAIKVAKEIPVEKPEVKYEVGDEVMLKSIDGTKRFCYVVDAVTDLPLMKFVRLFDTEKKVSTVVEDFSCL